ncbi:hypothetical protein LTR22_019958 [Elasticomyces elasticus]|nr:hypothetical protein LTR22_019958 [Elasticomyces elasticus]
MEGARKDPAILFDELINPSVPPRMICASKSACYLYNLFVLMSNVCAYAVVNKLYLTAVA